MTIATALSSTILGIDAFPIQVEVDLGYGLPSFQVVGLGDHAVREARDRIKSAIKNSHYSFYQHRITANLAPADLRKEGSGFDLPIALALLAAQGVVPIESLQSVLCIGELSLTGEVRRVSGALSAAILANESQKKILLPIHNLAEAQVVEGLEILPVQNLTEAVNILNGKMPKSQNQPKQNPEPQIALNNEPDLAEVCGQAHAKRALEVAAAGGHNILLIGPPGSGKTMLASRLPSILPKLSFLEALETTKIYSVTNLLEPHQSLVMTRPFRSPHHSISDAGLVGGGTVPKPGEISLAHNGVLFLDELPEFKKHVLEVMRQPLEDRKITISRASFRATYPANIMLVASMNPCPCGFYGDPHHECRCSKFEIQKYQSRISGPLMDRIDIQIEMPSIPYREFNTSIENNVGSKEIRHRVEVCRMTQEKRFKQHKNIFVNAQMQNKSIQTYCNLAKPCQEKLERVVDTFGLSARAASRVLKVARTIADLDKQATIQEAHLAEAIQYRSLDRMARLI